MQDGAAAAESVEGCNALEQGWKSAAMVVVVLVLVFVVFVVFVVAVYELKRLLLSSAASIALQRSQQSPSTQSTALNLVFFKASNAFDSIKTPLLSWRFN